MRYIGKIEDGYVKVYRDRELIAAGIVDASVTGKVRDIGFMKDVYRINNQIRIKTMNVMEATIARIGVAKPILTLCGAQEEFIQTINAGHSRWSHRRDMGHYGRILGGAKKKLANQMRRMGVKEAQIPTLIRDAIDVAELRRNAEE